MRTVLSNKESIELEEKEFKIFFEKGIKNLKDKDKFFKFTPTIAKVHYLCASITVITNIRRYFANNLELNDILISSGALLINIIALYGAKKSQKYSDAAFQIRISRLLADYLNNTPTIPEVSRFIGFKFQKYCEEKTTLSLICKETRNIMLSKKPLKSENKNNTLIKILEADNVAPNVLSFLEWDEGFINTKNPGFLFTRINQNSGYFALNSEENIIDFVSEKAEMN